MLVQESFKTTIGEGGEEGGGNEWLSSDFRLKHVSIPARKICLRKLCQKWTMIKSAPGLLEYLFNHCPEKEGAKTKGLFVFITFESNIELIQLLIMAL